MGVGDSDDHVLGSLLAPLGLTLLLQQAEGEGRLRGRAALGDIDHAKALTLQIGGQFVEVVLANVVAGKEDDRVAVVADQPRETIAQGLDDGACAEVRTSDTGHDDIVALAAERVGHGLHLVEKLRCDARRQMQPSEEVIAWAGALLQSGLSRCYLRCVSLQGPRIEEGERLGDV